MATTTKELLGEVLGAMAGAADGESGALGRLGAMTAKEGTVGASAAAASTVPTPAGPAVTAHTITERIIARPNGVSYHVRKIGIHDDVAYLRKSREAGLATMGYGPPGTGKTALVEAAFAQPGGGGIWTLQGSGDTEVADFVGGFTQMPDGTYKWIDGPLLEAMEAGGVLYVDEIPLIDPKVLAGVLYPLMDGRGELRVTQNPERGVVRAAPGFYVTSACNPNASGARMSEALLSRFALQFQVTTDYKLALKLGVPAKMVTAAQNLAKKFDNSEVSWAPQLRELLDFKRVSEAFGEDLALRNVVSTAPEMDRPTVAEVLTMAFGQIVKELKLGA